MRIGLKDIETGKITVVIGANGAGKTTMLANLANSVEGSAMQRARQVAMVVQNPVVPVLKVTDYVMLGRLPWQKTLAVGNSRHDKKKVADTLAMLGIEHLSDKMTNTLSGGEFKLVAIARAVAQQTLYILLDEVTANSDPHNVKATVAVLKKLAAQGTAIVMVVHDINLALQIADNVVVLTKAKDLSAGDVLDFGYVKSCVLYKGNPEGVGTELLTQAYGVSFNSKTAYFVE